ncbi:Tat pathway signal protein [Humitalea sp. 24SJ18S-53]|uniref:Tat pathway signal protein n=1 Tax=Humitalea sp. 24SJ18S-53 TaxID=3422307 RepID=UPI003D676DC0
MRAWFGALALVLGLCAAAPAEAQNRFWLQNNTGQTILSAYVSPSRISDWGPDILGASVLPPGQRVWVTPNTSDCQIDVRVTYQGGGEDRRMGVNACSLTTITFGGGGGAAVAPQGKGVVTQSRNPSFNFVNQSGAVIREVYVSLSSESVWGVDRLGANTLAPGQSVAINLPVGRDCNVDMRVVFMNGAAQERRRVETCSRTEFGWR